MDKPENNKKSKFWRNVIIIVAVALSLLTFVICASYSKSANTREAQIKEYRDRARDRGEKLDWPYDFYPPDIHRGREIHDRVLDFSNIMPSEWPEPVDEASINDRDGWKHPMDKDAVKDFLDEHARAIILMDEILASPRTVLPPFDANQNPWALYLPHLQPCRLMANLSVLRARYIAETEGIDKGLESLAQSYALRGLYNEGDPTLVSHLVKIAVEAILNAGIRSVLADPHGTPGPESIRHLVEVMSVPDEGMPLSLAFQFERASAIWMMATEKRWRDVNSSMLVGIGGIIPSVTSYAPLAERNRNLIHFLRFYDSLIPAIERIERDPDDPENLEELARIYRELSDALARDETKLANSWTFGFFVELECGILMGLLVPAFNRAVDAHLRMIGNRRATTFGLTILADKLEGKPIDMDGLTPPFNPYTKEPIIIEHDENHIVIRSGLRKGDEAKMEPVMTIPLGDIK